MAWFEKVKKITLSSKIENWQFNHKNQFEKDDGFKEMKVTPKLDQDQTKEDGTKGKDDQKNKEDPKNQYSLISEDDFKNV